MVNNSDIEDIIFKIQNNSIDYLEELYILTKDSIYGFSLSILKNTHEAEEVLQEVFIKIYNSIYSYIPSGKPLAWILTITKNLCYMRIRDNKNHIDINSLENTLTSGVNNNVEDKIFIETIFEYISDEERNILTLHSISGFKHREIAKILDLPLATVLSKYNRAIKKIKKRMSEEKYEKA